MVRPESANDRHGVRTTRSGTPSERSSSRKGYPSQLSSRSSSSSMLSSSSAPPRSTSQNKVPRISGEHSAKCSFGSSQNTSNMKPVQPQRSEVHTEMQRDRPRSTPCSPRAWGRDLSGRYKSGYRMNQMDYYLRTSSRDVPPQSGISSRVQSQGVLSSGGAGGLRKPQIRTHSPAQRKIKKPLPTPRPRGNDTTCAGRTA